MQVDKIIVYLDTIPKIRNCSEYRMINRARSGDLELIGDGPIVQKLLRKRFEQGASKEAIVEVYRGDTLCFVPTPLKSWVIPARRAKQGRSKGTPGSTCDALCVEWLPSSETGTQ